MAFREVMKSAAPLGLVDGIRRQRGARRAGLDVTLAQATFGQRAALLERAGLAALPPGVFAGTGAVVDVGAHYGEWTAAVLAFVGNRRLIAIEPTPKSAAGFRQRHGDDPRVSLHEVAVGAQIGNARVTLSTRSVFNSLLPIRAEISAKYAGVAEVGVVDVPCTTLDALLGELPEIALLKIDVQGTEADVLAGAAQTLERTASILIEMNFVSHYEGDSLAWELHPLLTSAGFGLHNFIHEYADDEGRLLWADAVYRRL